uniref:G_PROTEIN_RECEP_F1_2 domain-containing protein n=1 Tax=Parastrongyloides trichosuri TaxID=131310 RepID=A0A0N4Z8P9_PARTI
MCSRTPDVALLVRSQQFMNDFRLAGMDNHYVTNSTGHNVLAVSLGIEELEKHCYDEKVANFAHLLKIAANTLGTSENCTETINPELAEMTMYYIKIALTFIFVTVFIFGSIGNILTVLVINKTKLLHNQTNYFLASLSCSDFLLILIGVPFDLISIWHPRRHLNIDYYCEITSTSISLFTFASILVIVSLTAERFFAICYPFSLRSKFDKRMAVKAIYGAWLIALVPSIYFGMQFKVVSKDFCGFNREVEVFTDYNGYTLNNNETITEVNSPLEKAKHMFGSCDFVRKDRSIINRYTFEIMLVVTFILPVTFIVYCYIRILQTLSDISSFQISLSPKTSIVSHGNESEGNNKSINGTYSKNCGTTTTGRKSISHTCVLKNNVRHKSSYKESINNTTTSLLTVHSGNDRILSNQRAQKVVTKMLLTVTSVFFLCYLPYHIERLIVIYGGDFCDSSTFCRLLYPITGLLQYVSAMLNPFIYNVMSIRFRNSFKAFFQNMFGKFQRDRKNFKKKRNTNGDDFNKIKQRRIET